jgi:hypothetical protein
MADDSCVYVLGEGDNDCPTLGANSIDCQEDKYHNECNYLNQCIPVAGADEDECQTPENCVDQNNRPTASKLKVSIPDSTSVCAGIGGLFSWEYGDVDNDKEIRFILEINDDPTFENTSEIREMVSEILFAPGTTNRQSVYVASPGKLINNSINYNMPYYWRVMVTDEHGLDSEWTYFNGNENNGTIVKTNAEQYTFAGHSAPSPQFIDPTNPVPLNESILFDDKSICYSETGPYDCYLKNPKNEYNNYNWWFGDAVAPYNLPADSSQVGDVSHTYTKTSTGVTLQVCDELGQCCDKFHTLKVKTSTGQGGGIWKEISPF